MKVYQLLVHLHLFTFYFSHTPIHEVVPNAVRIADIIDASICNDHFTTSFLLIVLTLYYSLFVIHYSLFTLHSKRRGFRPIA